MGIAVLRKPLSLHLLRNDNLLHSLKSRDAWRITVFLPQCQLAKEKRNRVMPSASSAGERAGTRVTRWDWRGVPPLQGGNVALWPPHGSPYWKSHQIDECVCIPSIFLRRKHEFVQALSCGGGYTDQNKVSSVHRRVRENLDRRMTG